MFFKVFANVGFRYFEALDGPLGPILALLGPVWSQNASQNGFQNSTKSRDLLTVNPAGALLESKIAQNREISYQAFTT